MQYHLNGFRPGDPALAEAVVPAAHRTKVDVLIVGCGPAGLTLAAQLARFPDISTRIVERKEGPLQFGQADGIACRSMEMFQAFGFAHKVAREAYHVNEVTFWRPDDGGLARADRIRDVEDDLSEMPHVILSQARVHDFYLDIMAQSPTRLVPDYATELVDLTRDADNTHPVCATLRRSGGEEETVRARYVVGCDGARSTVRRAMGQRLEGASARQLWGVMDVLAVTDFPDIRLKCAIQSAGAGSLLIIPREGGYMVRMYIELDELEEGERAADRGLTDAVLIDKARAILDPFTLDVRQVAWWSAYEIGQRVCDVFDDATPDRVPRIFIAGDACHTHSPKAGQGMNVSMADAFNLGWKLAAVLRGQSHPDLLRSYSAERRAKAKELIDFDRDMARLFSEPADTPQKAAQFQAYFQRHGRYTAGVETRYDTSGVIGDAAHRKLAAGLPPGKRFHSAPVVRLADAHRMELGHCLTADGRWRVLIFAPDTNDLEPVCRALAPLVARFTPKTDDPDAVLDVRAVLRVSHRELDLRDVPDLLRPAKGRLGLTDTEKVFCAAPGGDTDFFARRGIDPVAGALVLVRPDQFVAQVLPLDGLSELESFLSDVLLDQQS